MQQVRSVLHPNVHIIALTATATMTIQNEIAESLKMKNMAVICFSPDKSNVKCMVSNYDTMGKAFESMANQIAQQQISLGRTIIFCLNAAYCIDFLDIN